MTTLALSATATDDTRPVLHLVFKVGAADYALASDIVLQIESFSGATCVPGTQPYVVGLLQLRGRVIPVIDLRTRFGLPAKEPTLETRVVVGEHGERVVALVVDSAREVAHLSKAQLTPPPRIVEEGASGFVKSVARVGERMILVLDFAKVIGEEPIDV